MTESPLPSLGPRRAGRRIAARPQRHFRLIVDHADAPPAVGQACRWGAPVAPFAMVLLASILLWAAIGAGLWRLTQAAW